MGKCRIKTEEVDVYQLGHGQMPSWFMRAVEARTIVLWPDAGHCIAIRQEDNDTTYAYRGDFVCLRSDEYIFVVRPDTFTNVYEPVPETVEKKTEPLVEIKKAEVIDGFALGSSISIVAEFKGAICEEHLEAYIEKLTDLLAKIRKYRHGEGVTT